MKGDRPTDQLFLFPFHPFLSFSVLLHPRMGQRKILRQLTYSLDTSQYPVISLDISTAGGQNRIETLTVFNIPSRSFSAHETRTLPRDFHVIALHEQVPYPLDRVAEDGRAHGILPALEVLLLVGPAVGVDEGVADVGVDGFVDAADTLGRRDELAFVREQHLVARRRVGDARVQAREQVRRVLEAEAVAARIAVADLARPAQVQHPRAHGIEVVADPGVELARVVHIGLEEQRVLGERVPVVEDMVEVRLAFAADVRDQSHVVRARAHSDPIDVGSVVFDVKVHRGLAHSWHCSDGGDEARDFVNPFFVHANHHLDTRRRCVFQVQHWPCRGYVVMYFVGKIQNQKRDPYRGDDDCGCKGRDTTEKALMLFIPST